jgi:2-polyprenyl-3-methyl-5-hydroxy-6-metoxy-1,4-benzoquinol methylase
MKRATFRLRLALIRRFLRPDVVAQPLTHQQPELPADPKKKTGAPAQPRILDVGCATGYFLELAKEEGFQPYGVEYSAYAAARARLRVGEEAIFQGTLEQSVFPKASFTAIALSDLLEHVRTPAGTLELAKDLLKSGGVILIMTPDTGSLSRYVMGQRWTHYKTEHLFYFNRRSITWLANRCGLRVAHFERSKKALNLAYLHSQFGVYSHWLLTPLIGFLYRLAPVSLRQHNFYLSIGEMVVILKKLA